LVADALAPKLLHPTVLVDNGTSSPAERVSRRAIYTPVSGGANAREQGSFLALLERQSKPASLIVGVG
jgi:hypothetical protein